MASASVPGMHSWSNPYPLSLPGTCRPSPSQGRGPKVPFLLSCVVAGRADRMRLRACTSPFFQRLVQCDLPCHPRFLVTPRLLTRLSPLPWGGPFSLLSLIGCCESWGLEVRVGRDPMSRGCHQIAISDSTITVMTEDDTHEDLSSLDKHCGLHRRCRTPKPGGWG
jgi:hypothetical protein